MSIEAIKRWVEIFGGADWHDELVDSAWAEKANQAVKEMYQAIEQAQKQEHRNIRERWNIERDGDDLLVCFNDHEKSEGCRYERYVLADTSPPQRQPLTDEEIEAAFKKCGGRWNGDHWVIEDADLHPFVRAIESPELNTLRAISDEYNAWIRHHAAGHTYDDFLATRKAAHGIKGGT